MNNTKQCSCSSVSALVPPSPCPSDCPDVHFNLGASESSNSLKRMHSSPSTSSERSILSAGSVAPKQRLHVTVTIILLLICITLSASVIALFVVVFDLKEQLSNDMQSKNDGTDICLPCSDLKVGPFPDDNSHMSSLTKKVKDSIEVCCSSSPVQASSMLNMVFDKRKNFTRAIELVQGQQGKPCKANCSKGNDVRENIAAHLLFGARVPVSNSEKGPSAVRDWSLINPITHVTGLQFKNDRIRVNTSGLYFVYSQVYFLTQYVNGQSPSPTTLYHYVYRFNVIYPNGGEELLLKSVRTQCWERKKSYDDHTSYTGGVFHLNIGDEIYVKVSNITEVSQDSKATFLGMFKLT